ncbi:MAG: hypothetical protein RLZZ584_492 [Pseudomonadota bacterium]|jgi:hypothetical protein
MKSIPSPATARCTQRLIDRACSALTWLLAAVVLLLGLASGSVWAQPQAGRNFDHTRTGFALSGQHKQQRCESCHVNGVFKGTPRDCASCHTSGARFARGNQVMPQNHLPTARGCDTCHGTQGFTGARFSHAGVKAGSCASCHNGVTANGKTAGHIATTASCDSCHRVGAAWASNVQFDHAGVAAGSCASCHNGAKATGQSPRHVPNNSVSGMATSCDQCHRSGYASWLPAKVHANFAISSQCASCHSGSTPPAVGKPATAVHANAGACEGCHTSTSVWALGARPDHASFTSATNCANCHNGGTASAKSAAHIPTSQNCISCHNATAAGWKPTSWNHTQLPVAGQCTTCHSGAYVPADGPVAKHIAYKSVPAAAGASCDACHKAGYASWNPGTFHRNFSVSSGCASCHNAGALGATQKPNTAVHNGVTVCESCHTGTSSWAASGKPDHAAFTSSTSCSNCHNSGTAGGKPATHIPTTQNCASCHKATGAGWKPSLWNHTQQAVTGQCATCHSGGYAPADGPVANHIAYKSIPAAAAASCDACHKAGYASWNPGTLHRNFSVSSGCASCHNAGALGATQKPNTAVHNGVTVCESCHTGTSSWAASAKPDHASFTAATTCSNCHNGGAAGGKPATHIPTTLNCASCHKATGAGWKPSLWNHTQQAVAGRCATCHSGSYAPADGPVANHIAYKSVPAAASAGCDACHKAGYASWSPGTLHRNFSVSTGCASCHNAGALGATQRPNTAVHTGATVCETCHTTTSSWAATGKPNHASFTAATTCSTCHNGSTAVGKPSSHIPTTANCISCHNATASWRPSSFNHSQVTATGQCATCHSGSYAPADGVVSNHIPYRSVPAAAALNCDGCHKAGYASWNGGTFHRNVSVSTGCASCHSTLAYLGPTQARPNNATHTGVTVCESCHKSTSTWASATFAHSAANAVGSGTCDSCHNGGTAKGKSGTHVPVTAATAKCDSCHKSQTSFATAVTMNHGVVSTQACKGCHNGSYLGEGAQGARAKPNNHIPENQLLNGATMDCGACHTSTAAFTTVRMNHNSSMGNGAGWCKGCHLSGTSFPGGMDRKSLTHESKSASVTDCSMSGCHRPLGNKGAAYSKWD